MPWTLVAQKSRGRSVIHGSVSTNLVNSVCSTGDVDFTASSSSSSPPSSVNPATPAAAAAAVSSAGTGVRALDGAADHENGVLPPLRDGAGMTVSREKGNP